MSFEEFQFRILDHFISILCMKNQASNDPLPHNDVMVKEWDPLGKHKGFVMKLFPDNYGVGMFTYYGIVLKKNFTKIFVKDIIEVTVDDEKSSVHLHKHQMKMGKYMHCLLND